MTATDSLTLFTQELAEALRARGVSEREIAARVEALMLNPRLSAANRELSPLAQEIRARRWHASSPPTEELEAAGWFERFGWRRS